MKVLDVEGLGHASAIVRIDDEYILLLDTALTQDDRVDIMLGAMEKLDA